MSVVNGQNADAATFNSAFASKSADNTLTGKQSLNRPGSGDPILDAQQALNDVIDSDALKIPLAEKGVADGVATLDASTLVPVDQIPIITTSKISDFETATIGVIDTQKGIANGIAPLDSSSKIDSTYLPSYVDDVIEVADYASLPLVGEVSKIYLTLDTNYSYRWSGSVYVFIGRPIATTDDLAEGTTNKYFTDLRAQTAVISQTITNGVINKSPSEDAVFDALANKLNTSDFGTQFDSSFSTKTTDNLTEGTTNKYFTDLRAQTAVISQTITNGVITKSPSEDAVYDALVLKNSAITFKDEGFALGTAGTVDEIDFTGDGVTASRTLNKVTVNITGGGTGGGGSKNYIALSDINPDFELNTFAPWSDVQFSFSGGVPTGFSGAASNMDLSVSGTNPLSGNYSMLLTKSAANAQYQGFISDIFTIDREDVAKVLYGSFSYEVVSGTVDFSGTSTQSLEIWVQCFSSGQWIQPAGWRGMNQTSGSGKVVFSFQTDGDPAFNEYKIAVLTQQTDTNAYVVKFDEFKVGPEALVTGAPVTDFEDKGTVTIGATTTAPNKGTVLKDNILSRRVGDSAQLIYEFYQTTVAVTNPGGSGTYLFSLPAGMAFDTTKIETSGGVITNGIRSSVTPIGYGTVSQDNASGNNANVVLIPYNSTQFYAHISSSQTSAGTGGGTVDDTVGSAGYAMTVANTGYKFNITAPIAGYSSSVQFSNDTDTRVVGFIAEKNATQSIVTSSYTKVSYGVVTKDTHGGWDSGLNRYYIPVTGFYDIYAIQQYASSVTDNRLVVYVDGVLEKMLAYTNITSGVATISGSNSFYLNAGQYVEIYTLQNSGGSVNLTSNTTVNNVSILRRSGPSVIAASETVACEYTTTAGNTLSLATTTYIDFGTKLTDTHNSVLGAGSGNNTTATNTWRFVVPVSGRYLVTSVITIASATSTPSDYIITIHVDGSTRSAGMRVNMTTANTGGVALVGSSVLNLNAGQYISITGYQSTGTTRALSTSTGANRVSIVRVGN
jgi:hypothetical protein